MCYRKIIIFLCLFIIPVVILAKSGPPIPVPKLSISEAIDMAGRYLCDSEYRLKDTDLFPKSEYIIISAEYTNYSNQEYQKDWFWKIKFVHPVQNDHSIIYKVTNDKKVVFISASR